jgi:hypothetical protein
VFLTLHFFFLNFFLKTKKLLKKWKNKVDALMGDNHHHPTCSTARTHGGAAACVGARP